MCVTALTNSVMGITNEEDSVYINYVVANRAVGANWRSKVTVALVVLCALLAGAVVGVLIYTIHLKKSLQSLRAEYEAITGEACMTITDGWETDGRNSYFFSTKKLNWTESRAACQRAGGDLVKITSVEEQTFLEKMLKETTGMFWIGLTDFEVRGEVVVGGRLTTEQELELLGSRRTR
ncbi:low affinity immunoglobulin epsilon Fc receptor-like [Genypterus blacodes]|uniref:low affinity immunoglobulin epsilon Fc receptor-like n=1 Tax=Genypterus blacodes TaxID=154954 RepID=UPI003F7629C4